MKNRLIKRGFLGVPIGIAVGFVITVIISICIGDGLFYPITLELITKIGNELNAVILQTVLCGIIDSTFAMASVIWEIDSWSLTKQSGIYFTISCVVMFPIAYISHWMKHSIGGGSFLYRHIHCNSYLCLVDSICFVGKQNPKNE